MFSVYLHLFLFHTQDNDMLSDIYIYTAHKYTSLMDLIGNSQVMFLKSRRRATSLDLDHFIKTAGRNQVVNVS